MSERADEGIRQQAGGGSFQSALSVPLPRYCSQGASLC